MKDRENGPRLTWQYFVLNLRGICMFVLSFGYNGIHSIKKKKETKQKPNKMCLNFNLKLFSNMSLLAQTMFNFV